MNLKARAGNWTAIAAVNEHPNAESIGAGMNRAGLLIGFQLQKGGFRGFCAQRKEQEEKTEQECKHEVRLSMTGDQHQAVPKIMEIIMDDRSCGEKHRVEHDTDDRESDERFLGDVHFEMTGDTQMTSGLRVNGRHGLPP
jgi:hypothetical protein